MLRKIAGFLDWRLLLALAWSLGWLIGQQYLLYAAREALIDNLPSVGAHWTALPPGVLQGAGAYALAMLVLYGGFALLNAAAFKALLAPRLAPRAQVLALVGQLLLATLVLQLAVSWVAPYSVSGDLLLIFLHAASARVIFWALCALLGGYYLAFIISSLLRTRRRRVGAIAVLACGALALSWNGASRHPDAGGRPDVIVIGVDSLRPDHLRRFGAPFEVMPNLERFLGAARVYDDVLSPQPHTFPSTIGILTGQWPVTNGARGNLFPVDHINTLGSIAYRFKAQGYETAFAMDETRFANIDQGYGFDQVYSPGMGLSEIATSFIADNALSNLVSATPVARWLLPDLYGNRALSQLYRPAAFSERLHKGLDRTDDDRPLFLYVHFCAAHWPYRVAGPFDHDGFGALPGKGSYADASSGYLRALSAADTQFEALLEDLRRRGRLDNAIVTVLSDHGEDFNLSKDLLETDAGEILGDRVNGHGGSAYRNPQVSVLLAFRRYGQGELPMAPRDAPVSLVDVAPTLARMAGLPAAPGSFDGVDLVTRPPAADRIRFVESSYFPNALNGPDIDEAAVAGEVAGMYRITAKGRVEVKPDWLEYQLTYRQRAAYQGDWVVALSETPDASPIVLHRSQQRWYPYAQAPAEAPKQQLMRQICTHWRQDRVVAERCRDTGIWARLTSAPAVPGRS